MCIFGGGGSTSAVTDPQAEAAQATRVDDILTGTYLVDEVEGEDTTVNITPDACDVPTLTSPVNVDIPVISTLPLTVSAASAVVVPIPT